MIVLENFNEKVYGNLAVVYHRNRTTDIINGILERGFIPGEGAMYGKGWYCTYDIDSQLNNNMVDNYGGILLKLKVNLQKFLIFDYDAAKTIYGTNYRLQDQWKTITGSSHANPKVIKVKIDIQTPWDRASLEAKYGSKANSENVFSRAFDKIMHSYYASNLAYFAVQIEQGKSEFGYITVELKNGKKYQFTHKLRESFVPNFAIPSESFTDRDMMAMYKKKYGSNPDYLEGGNPENLFYAIGKNKRSLKTDSVVKRQILNVFRIADIKTISYGEDVSNLGNESKIGTISSLLEELNAEIEASGSHTVTASFALKVYKRFPEIQEKVRGLLFTGNTDGRVVVAYDWESLTPLSYCEAYGNFDTNTVVFVKKNARSLDFEFWKKEWDDFVAQNGDKIKEVFTVMDLVWLNQKTHKWVVPGRITYSYFWDANSIALSASITPPPYLLNFYNTEDTHGNDFFVYPMSSIEIIQHVDPEKPSTWIPIKTPAATRAAFKAQQKLLST